jgi:hypothetical protein
LKEKEKTFHQEFMPRTLKQIKDGEFVKFPILCGVRNRSAGEMKYWSARYWKIANTPILQYSTTPVFK